MDMTISMPLHPLFYIGCASHIFGIVGAFENVNDIHELNVPNFGGGLHRSLPFKYRFA